MIRFLCFVTLVLPCLAADNRKPSFSRDRGLTNEERQVLIDQQNAWRAHVALGKEKNAPPSKYMVAMEYDDRLEEGAQRWADVCKPGHNDFKENHFKPYYDVGQSVVAGEKYGTQQGLESAKKHNLKSATLTTIIQIRRMTWDWYKEVKDYNYDRAFCTPGKMCGHYTALIHANTTLFGCGYNKCPGIKSPYYLVCHYATGGNIKEVGASQRSRPYAPASGSPCANCPQGYGFCMDNALCASARACQNTKSRCQCTIRRCENGGRLNQRECKCECPPGREGLNCEKSCADVWDTRRCQGGTHNCYFTGYWRTMRNSCRTTCSKYCGVFQVPDNGHQNRNRIQTNVVEPIIPPPIDNKKKAPRGPCDNRASNEECDQLYFDGKCKQNPEWMDYFCPSSCDTCQKRAPKPGCLDVWDKPDCDEHVSKGKCREEYMTSWCAKSCNSCQKKSNWDCKDEADHQCAIKAAFGECKSSITTRVDCPLSCNTCKAKRVRGSCRNRNSDSKCEERAKYGMCILNQRYMERFCASSCNKC